MPSQKLSFLSLLLFLSASCMTQQSRLQTQSGAKLAKVQFFRYENKKRIAVTKRRSADLIGVEISGLDSTQSYVVRSTLGVQQAKMEAVADANGVIDTMNTPSVRGTYEGVDPDGLFWSMISSPTAIPSAGAWRFEILKRDQVIASATLPYGYPDNVQIVDVHESGIVGKIYLPKSTKASPAVIVLSGSEGGIDFTASTSMALAAQGYVAFSLAWFGAPGVPAELANIRLEYFGSAMEWLAARPDVDGNRIGILGTSRGGELSLLVGSRFSKIKAVVGRVPSPYRWGGNAEPDASGSTKPAWTYLGQPLPFLETKSDLNLDQITFPDGSTAFANAPGFMRGFEAATPTELENATTAIERINGPVFLIGGSDDQVWPSCFLSDKAMQRLKDKNHPFKDEFMCVERGGHSAASEPNLPTTSLAFMHPHMQMRIAVGGEPQAIAKGQRESWSRTLHFLSQALDHK